MRCMSKRTKIFILTLIDAWRILIAELTFISAWMIQLLNFIMCKRTIIFEFAIVYLITNDVLVIFTWSSAVYFMMIIEAYLYVVRVWINGTVTIKSTGLSLECFKIKSEKIIFFLIHIVLMKVRTKSCWTVFKEMALFSQII